MDDRQKPQPAVDDITWDSSGDASPAWREAVANAPKARPSKVRGTDPVPGHDTTRPPEAALVTLPLTAIGVLLAEPEEQIDYVVEGLIAKNSVNAIAGKPKTGKSTLARFLALAVVRGDDFLGRQCHRGTVWYIDLENRRRDVRNHFRQMGAREADPLWLLVGQQAPKNIIDAVRQRATKERPDLIIIDTMQRFLKAKDTDNYAEMTLLFDHVIGIARMSGAAVLLLTHSSKIEKSGLDAILGSTAIAGSLDTGILLNRSPRYRTIATIQRSGDDLAETLLELDPTTGALRLAGSRARADEAIVQHDLYDALANAADPLTQAEWFGLVEARKTVKLAAFKPLLAVGNDGNQKVVRLGAGTKNQPFRYQLGVSNSSSVVPLRGGNHHFSPPLFEESLNDSSGNSSSQVPTENDSGSQPHRPATDEDDDGVY
jgi:hypothetical protein